MEEIEVEGAAEGYVKLFNRYGVDYVISSPGAVLPKHLPINPLPRGNATSQTLSLGL